MKKKSNCGRKSVLKHNQQIRNYVIQRLKLRWTLKQISGRAKLEKQAFSISYNTIYSAVHSVILPIEIKKIMRFMNKHKKHKSSNDNRGKIPNTVNISQRPNGCTNRSRLGYFKYD